MSEELIPHVPQEMLPPASNRIVVFGSISSGALDLAENFEKYLKDKSIDSAVTVQNNLEGIERTFFDRGEGKTDTLPKGVIVLPKMHYYPDGKGMSVDTHSGKLHIKGKVYETVFEYIKDICNENGVPIVDLNHESLNIEGLTGGIEKLIAAPKDG